MAKLDKNTKEMYDWFLNLFDCKELRYLPDKVLEEVLETVINVMDEEQ